MKKFLTLLIFTFIISFSYSQDKQLIRHQMDSILQTQIQNRYDQDTLWVKDSSLRYKYISDQGQMVLERTYRVLSRNDFGNYLISEDLVDNDFPTPWFTGNSRVDTITYFDGEHTQIHTTWSWNSAEENWIKNNYSEYVSPLQLSVMFNKMFINSSNNYYNGYCQRYKYYGTRLDTLYYDDYLPETDSWLPVSKKIFFYAGNDLDTLQLIYRKVALDWVDSLRVQRTFESDTLVQSISLIKDQVNNTWTKYKLVYYHNNSFGEPDTITNKYWNELTNSWYDFKKDIYFYDNQGSCIGYLRMSYNPQTQILENHDRTTILRTPDSETSISQIWDQDTQSFRNQTKTYYSFVTDIVKDTLQYDVWDIDAQSWQPVELTVNRFDNHFNTIESIIFEYGQSAWEVYSKTDYYWSPFIPNAISENNTDIALFVYPNPASTQVSFELPGKCSIQNKEALIQIFNLSGQKVAETSMKEGKVVWDCSSVKPGLYVYTTERTGMKCTGKILVQ